jgi:hypothetical protein
LLRFSVSAQYKQPFSIKEQHTRPAICQMQKNIFFPKQFQIYEVLKGFHTVRTSWQADEKTWSLDVLMVCKIRVKAQVIITI